VYSCSDLGTAGGGGSRQPRLRRRPTKTQTVLQAGRKLGRSAWHSATMPDLHHALPALPLSRPQRQIFAEVFECKRKYFKLFSIKPLKAFLAKT